MTGTLLVLAAYIVGGIPFGFIFYRALRGGDIREVGSGNIGATNITRTAGWGLGLLTLALDAGKGALAAGAGLALMGDPAWAAASGFAAIVGHCFPVWLSFRGGKGVATGAGAFLVLDPIAMVAALAIFLLGALLTRVVAVGSILSAVAYALVAAIPGRKGLGAALWGAAAALLIVFRHHRNIRRLMRGEEPRFLGKGRAKEG